MYSSSKDAWESSCFELFLTEEFEGEYIAFNPLSGETHVLNEYARAILEHIARAPLTVDELGVRLGDFQQIESDPKILFDHLAQLEEWGIAQRVT